MYTLMAVENWLIKTLPSAEGEASVGGNKSRSKERGPTVAQFAII